LIGRSSTTTRDALIGALEFKDREIGRADEMRMCRILEGLGWVKHKSGGVRSWVKP
jgi:hypothetical protein